MDDTSSLLRILRQHRDGLEDKLDGNADLPYWAAASYEARYSPDWRVQLADVNAMIARRLVTP